MFQRVLVAYDGSEGAKEALDAGVGVARRDRGELIGLEIEAHLPHYGATVGEVEAERHFEEQACAQLLEEASRHAAGRGVALQANVRAGHPAQEIVRAAHDHGADPIPTSYGEDSYRRVFGAPPDAVPAAVADSRP